MAKPVDPLAIGTVKPSPINIREVASEAFRNFVRTALVALFAFIGLGYLAVAWRAVDVYEHQVAGQAVQVKIEVERHELWKRQMASAQIAAQSKDELMQAVKERAASVPANPTPSAPVSEPGVTRCR